MKTMIVIPARLASSRLPEKMLLDQTGLPLIQHTHRQACKSRLADKVVVATDHQRIFDVVQSFGGEVVMTDPACPSGSDRVAEVAGLFPDFDLFCNVQGDEPEIEPETIDKAIQLLSASDSDEAALGTLATPITCPKKLADPNCVKVVVNKKQEALYFSRAPIPFPRDAASQVGEDGLGELSSIPSGTFLQHIGIYTYRRSFLEIWPSLPACEIEGLEKLEQLRVLDAGYRIKVDLVAESKPGIDTEEDYRAFVSRTNSC